MIYEENHTCSVDYCGLVFKLISGTQRKFIKLISACLVQIPQLPAFNIEFEQ